MPVLAKSHRQPTRGEPIASAETLSREAARAALTAYDDVDNTTRVATPMVNATASYNALDQILQAAGKAYRYDANGNLLAGEKPQTYKYDAENRLTEIDYVGTSNKSVFTYNGLNQRVADSETVNGVTTTTHYLWCGAGICQTSTSTGTVTRRDLDEGEYNVITGQKLVYQTDQLGSVRDVIDATTGTRVQSYDYSPYGAVVRSNGSTPTDYQFAGLMYHPQSGLLISATRFYDTLSGRWLNRDPIREFGGNNQYAYVGANPMSRIDLFGFSSINLFPPGSPQSSNDTQFNPPGTFSVGGHGNSQSMFDPNSNALTPQDVANIIKGDPRYHNGDSVWLNSCSTGQGGNSFAQQLANILNAPVSAPDNTQWYIPWESTILGIPYDHYVTESIGPTRSGNSGKRITFFPQR